MKAVIISVEHLMHLSFETYHLLKQKVIIKTDEFERNLIIETDTPIINYFEPGKPERLFYWENEDKTFPQFNDFCKFYELEIEKTNES